MKRINKLTQKLGKWFSKDSGETESPLLLQSLEDRVLYSAVPLPVDNVDAPVETADLDDVQFIEIESNTTMPIGEAIAEDTSSQFLADDIQNADFVAASADATLEDLEQMINAIEESDSVSTEDDGPRTARGLVAVSFGENTFQEGQSFTINEDFLGLANLNSHITLEVEPSFGVIYNDGILVSQGDEVTKADIDANQVVFVPDSNFVGNDRIEFLVPGNLSNDIYLLEYRGVADDGFATLGNTFAPLDGSTPVFSADPTGSETQIAALSDGDPQTDDGYVVVGLSGSDAGSLEFQRFDSSGIALGNPVVVDNFYNNLEHVAVASDNDGGFFIAFEGEDDGDNEVIIQRYDANGQPVNFSTGDVQIGIRANAADISLTYLNEERFVVSIADDTTNDVELATFNLDGTPISQNGAAFAIPGSSSLSTQTALLTDGTFVTARVVQDLSGNNSVLATILDPGSHVTRQEFDLGISLDDSDFALVATPENGFAIVWQDASGINAARYDLTGQVVVAPETIANSTPSIDASPDIVSLTDGSFVISHTVIGENGMQEVVAQRFDNNFVALGDEFTINSFGFNDQTDAQLAVLSDGTLVATFISGNGTSPSTIFSQRLQMVVTGNENSEIELDLVAGVHLSNIATTPFGQALSQESISEITLLGLPTDTVVFYDDNMGNEVERDVVENPSTNNSFQLPAISDFSNLRVQLPEGETGNIDATLSYLSRDQASFERIEVPFQIQVAPEVIDSPTIVTGSVSANEDILLELSPAEFTNSLFPELGGLPDDLDNAISNVSFAEPDFRDHINVSQSPTSGISSSFSFDGTTPLTAMLPQLDQAASFEFFIRSEDFDGVNDRVIAQFGDNSQGFIILQRQDEVVLRFGSADTGSEAFQLSADGLGGLQGSGPYDQIVVTFGNGAGDPDELDVAIYLNGDLAESITDIKSLQVEDILQATNELTLNLGQPGSNVGFEGTPLENFGGELGLLRVENTALDQDDVKQRFIDINNAPQIVSINGVEIQPGAEIQVTSLENSFESFIRITDNGDFVFDPRDGFNTLRAGETETIELDVNLQSGAEFFDVVPTIIVEGANDVPVQNIFELSATRDGGDQLFILNDIVTEIDGSTANPPVQPPPTSIFLRDARDGLNVFVDGNGDAVLQFQPFHFQDTSIESVDFVIRVIEPDTGLEVDYPVTINIREEFSISGRVAHDADLDGSIDNDTGFDDAVVYLYRANNGDIDLTNVTLVADTETETDGSFFFDQYEFNSPGANLSSDETYFVVVDSLSVLLQGENRRDIWAQQTFASQNALQVRDNVLGLSADDGYFIGGKDTELSDQFGFDVDQFGFNALPTGAQHVIVVPANSDLQDSNELGFGFNFDVVNVVSDEDQGAGQFVDGQGTLRQFIHNSNDITGPNRLVFVPTSDAVGSDSDGNQFFRIEIESVLPEISDDQTIIDGTAYKTSVNELVRVNATPNPVQGVAGEGGIQVGVDGDRTGGPDYFLSEVSTPDLEITPSEFDSNGNPVGDIPFGLIVRGNSDNLDVGGVEIRNIAIHGFGRGGSGSSGTGNIVIDGTDENGTVYNVSDFTLAGNVIGARPDLTEFLAGHNSGSNVVILSADGADSSIENNIIVNADLRGIFLSSAVSAPSNRGWLIQNNQVSFNGLREGTSGDGIDIYGDSGSIDVVGNYISGNFAVGIDAFRASGGISIVGNTIENNRPQDGSATLEGGGIRLFGIGNEVFGNVIENNAGAGVHIIGDTIVAPTSFHNTISRNEFSNNDGISIDLSDPLSPSNGLDAVTAIQFGDGIDPIDGNLDSSRGNLGLDAPEIESATYDGNKLTVKFNANLINPSANDGTVEIYLTENGFAHGEGNIFLGEVSFTNGLLQDGFYVAELFPQIDGLPLDLTQEITINATVTSSFAVDIAAEGVVVGANTSEFSFSQIVNRPPIITSANTASVLDTDTFVLTLEGNDPDGDNVTFTVVQSTTDDSNLFTIDNGNLVFNAPQAFDNQPGANNDYQVDIQAEDEEGGVSVQTVTVSVTDGNSDPVITSLDVASVSDIDTFVLAPTANDVDGDNVTFTVVQSTTDDSSLFTIDNGNLVFNALQPFDNQPGANNDYQVDIQVDDGEGGVTTQTVTVSVTDGNSDPVITSLDVASVSDIDTFVLTPTANDVDGDNVTFTVVQSTTDDSSLFTIDNGNLVFNAPQAFDNQPGANNDYQVDIQADDGEGGVTTQTVTVTVTDGNTAPVITSSDAASVLDTNTVVVALEATDVDGEIPTFTVVQSANDDSSLFTIDADNNLVFSMPQDFDNQFGADNDYQVDIQADDGEGGVTTQTVTVSVTDGNTAPVITSSDTVSVLDTSTVVLALEATDVDGETPTFTVLLSVDDDSNLFTVDADNNLVFFAPQASDNQPGAVNDYQVDIKAEDGEGGVTTQTVTVSVTDVNEAPIFVGNNQQLSLEQDESSTETFDLLELFADPEDQNLTLEIVGGANANLFQIVNNELTLIDVPELIGPESPTYQVEIVANDGVNDSITETVDLTINNINDAPESSVSVIPVSQDELVIASFGVDAQDRSDADDDATSLVITGNGADNSLFEVVNDRIQFIDPPVWQNGGQNTYIVTTALNDGTVNSEIITFEVTVENVNDSPIITDADPVIDSIDDFQLSNIQPGTFVADLNEATTFDSDGDTITFALGGPGQDNEMFFIDGGNNLRFASTAGLNGAQQENLDVTFVASDGQSNSAPQALSINVENDTVTGVNVVDISTPTTDTSNITDTQPQDQEPTTPSANEDDPADSSRPDVIAPVNPVNNGETTSPQPVTQRRNDINGTTAVTDSKIGDDDSFFELASDSVSYIYQSGAQGGPQLVSQEIGDIIEARHAVEDIKLEESMLANYFWQGFEDSEDEFIRKNLKADTTTIVAASAGLSLGLVSYLRLAAMATTVVTQLPAWKTLDVAPLISAFDEDEAETIHQIVDE